MVTPRPHQKHHTLRFVFLGLSFVCLASWFRAAHFGLPSSSAAVTRARTSSLSRPDRLLGEIMSSPRSQLSNAALPATHNCVTPPSALVAWYPGGANARH